MNSEGFIENRRKGLGGSDIGTLLGLNKYGTSLDVYLSKVQPQTEDRGLNLPAEIGHILEPVVARMFAKQNDLKLDDRTGFKYGVMKNAVAVPEKETVTWVNNPICRASLDFMYDRDGTSGVLECKTTRLQITETMDSHYCQALWYAGIMGVDEFTVSYLHIPMNFNYRYLYEYSMTRNPNYDSLVAALEYTEERFEFNEDLFLKMVTIASTFWREHVVPQIPPPPETVDDTLVLHPNHIEGRSMELVGYNHDLFQQLREKRVLVKKYGDEADGIADSMKMLMGDCESLTYQGRTLATWKKGNKSRMFLLKKKIILDKE